MERYWFHPSADEGNLENLQKFHNSDKLLPSGLAHNRSWRGDKSCQPPFTDERSKGR